MRNLAAVAAIAEATSASWRGAYLRETLHWVDIDAVLAEPVSGMPMWLAALVHDVAKPHTAATDEDGRLRFPRHGPRGGEMLRERLPHLGFDAAQTALVATFVRYHLRPRETRAFVAAYG